MTNSYEKFRFLMYQHNERKADVIRETGVTRPTLLKWEKGELPTIPVLRKIANHYSVSVKEFIDD